MINDIKTYAIIVLLLWQGLAQYQLHSVTKEYADYKENINDQVQKAINEKARIEAEQNAKYTMAQTGYAGALDELNRRLRNAENLPRSTSVQVAGCSGSTVSEASTDTTRTQVRLKAFKGTCDAEFYAEALRDNLQCQSLIDFIK